MSLRRLTEDLRDLTESADERRYLRDPVGMARLIALSTPDVSPEDTPNTAAGKAIRHLRTLMHRRSLLAQAFRLMRVRSRALETSRALQRRVSRAR
jgi:hypothetical protein